MKAWLLAIVFLASTAPSSLFAGCNWFSQGYVHNLSHRFVAIVGDDASCSPIGTSLAPNQHSSSTAVFDVDLLQCPVNSLCEGIRKGTWWWWDTEWKAFPNWYDVAGLQQTLTVRSVDCPPNYPCPARGCLKFDGRNSWN